MFAIFKKELTSFFASPIAYLVIGLILVLNGLFLWVFGGAFNLFEYGFADLSNFFLLAPWIFLFLVPAITMKSFSEERRLGTMELLLIKPVSPLQVVVGKFLASMGLMLLALAPTLLYAYTLDQLGTIGGSLDLGMTMGSYFGLIFLLANYTAIGIFTSALSDNQIVAFITGCALCFSFYYGFEALATLLNQGDQVLFVQSLGIKARVDSLARGILDTRDILYFVSLASFFLYLAIVQLKSLRHQ